MNVFNIMALLHTKRFHTDYHEIFEHFKVLATFKTGLMPRVPY